MLYPTVWVADEAAFRVVVEHIQVAEHRAQGFRVFRPIPNVWITSTSRESILNKAQIIPYGFHFARHFGFLAMQEAHHASPTAGRHFPQCVQTPRLRRSAIFTAEYSE
jgi:hypothetical protein